MSHFYKLTILKLKTSLKFKNHVLEFISYDWVNLWISHQGQFKANQKNSKNHLDLGNTSIHLLSFVKEIKTTSWGDFVLVISKKKCCVASRYSVLFVSSKQSGADVSGGSLAPSFISLNMMQ